MKRKYIKKIYWERLYIVLEQEVNIMKEQNKVENKNDTVKNTNIIIIFIVFAFSPSIIFIIKVIITDTNTPSTKVYIIRKETNLF